MKRKIVSIAVALGLLVGLMVVPAQAGTEDEIEASIVAGLSWLVAQQNPEGHWGEWESVARTGFAVVKLEDRAFELGKDPFQSDPAHPDYYEYSGSVIAGLDFIFSRAGSFGPGTGICFDKGGNETYMTGIAMMAIAASKDPNRVVTTGLYAGQTYMQVLQANVNYFAWSQRPDGGWIYAALPWGSDNSNTGYAVLGLRYAEDFGCAIPATVKPGLNNWINFIQNDPGPADDGGMPDPDGGSGYVSPDSWVNQLKTGNLLFEMAFVGDDTSTQRVIDAITYIQNHWNDANQDPGWKGTATGHPHYQAAYCLMKGFESMGIDTITVGGSDVDWFEEMSTAIVGSQNADGSWPSDYWGDSMLATEWALLTIEKIAPPPPDEPPLVWVEEAVNPSGKKVPPAGSSTMPGPKGGINDDGFYQLFAEDDHDPFPYMIICYWDPEATPPPGEAPPDGTPGWYVAVTDKAGDVFWCLSGTVIKLTQAPGAPPSVKKMGSSKGKASAVDYHITVPGYKADLPAGYPETIVVAYDASGNSSWVLSDVPPPPK